MNSGGTVSGSAVGPHRDHDVEGARAAGDERQIDRIAEDRRPGRLSARGERVERALEHVQLARGRDGVRIADQGGRVEIGPSARGVRRSDLVDEGGHVPSLGVLHDDPGAIRIRQDADAAPLPRVGDDDVRDGVGIDGRARRGGLPRGDGQRRDDGRGPQVDVRERAAIGGGSGPGGDGLEDRVTCGEDGIDEARIAVGNRSGLGREACRDGGRQVPRLGCRGDRVDDGPEMLARDRESAEREVEEHGGGAPGGEVIPGAGSYEPHQDDPVLGVDDVDLGRAVTDADAE